MKFFGKLNKEKGVASIAEMLLVMTTATVVIGGITVNTKDIINEAKDTQRVANLRQLTTALEFYYSDNLTYPQGDFEGVISELSQENYLGSLPTTPEKYEYQGLNDGEGYILKALLETPDSHYLENNNCQNPYYCLKM